MNSTPRHSREDTEHQQHPAGSKMRQHPRGDGRTGMRAGKGASQGAVKVLSGKTPSKEVGGVFRAKKGRVRQEFLLLEWQEGR